MSITEIPLEKSLFPSELGATNFRLFVSHQSDTIQDLRISFDSRVMAWVQIQEEVLFNYRPEICGPVFGGGFNPTKEYIITVGLKPEHVTVLSILFEGEDLLEWLLSPSNSVDLSDSENYLLYSVMQQITPKTQWGMTTTYHPVEM
jgi:hypothetical protein